MEEGNVREEKKEGGGWKEGEHEQLSEGVRTAALSAVITTEETHEFIVNVHTAHLLLFPVKVQQWDAWSNTAEDLKHKAHLFAGGEEHDCLCAEVRFYKAVQYVELVLQLHHNIVLRQLMRSCCDTLLVHSDVLRCV